MNMAARCDRRRDYAVFWGTSKINGPCYKLTMSCHSFEVNQLAVLPLFFPLLLYACVRVYVGFCGARYVHVNM